ncbi:hypothetical protein [Micromonospora sp. NPDC048830]|uniref:hypothetical protein n=1 Tax=Micromonospora sp. NPDC048830 TaxID=3364257 RepID=UPI003721D474
MLLPEAVAGLALHVPPGGALRTMRPLVYGYVRLNPADPQELGDCLMRDLAACAEREGFTLADVFTDRDARISDQFGRSGFVVMAETLRRPGVDGVLIPSLCHFSRFPGVHQAMRALIELETGARVFVMDQPPAEERHDDSGRATGAGSHDSSSSP